jgi:hypothetical protein
MNAPGHDGPWGGQGDANGDADDNGRWAGVTIPDDIRELDADVRAYHREQRRERRARRLRQLFDRLRPAASRRRRYRLLSLPLILALLLPATLVIVTMLVMLPQSLREEPRQLPLGHPTVPAGRPGGLVPQGAVTVDGQPRSLRDLRPAVLVVVPAACGCDSTLAQVDQQAAGFGLRVYLFAPASETKHLTELAQQLAGAIGVGTDPHHLLNAYTPAGPTAVFVHADAVVDDVVRHLPAKPDVATQLRTLAQAGAGR